MPRVKDTFNEFVELNNGKFWANSVLGGGTKFSFYPPSSTTTEGEYITLNTETEFI